MKFDYNKKYADETHNYFEFVKATAEWKARELCSLIENEKTDSLLEIGTGRGDVLNACYLFKKKVGADISEEALKQHHMEYGNGLLIKIDANSPLPFENDNFDFVLLCDILEHVEEPIIMLKEAARVGKYLLLKIPIENAFITGVTQRLQGINYGPNHPSGHLHCWSLKNAKKIINKAGLSIVRSKFTRIHLKSMKFRSPIKNILVIMLALLDNVTFSNFFTRSLIGGSFIAIAK